MFKRLLSIGLFALTLGAAVLFTPGSAEGQRKWGWYPYSPEPKSRTYQVSPRVETRYYVAPEYYYYTDYPGYYVEDDNRYLDPYSGRMYYWDPNSGRYYYWDPYTRRCYWAD